MSVNDPAAGSQFLKPIVDLLRQGLSPEKIALTIALGVVLGVAPVLGSTTLLCTLAAVTLRLNLPAIQIVNGAVYPLQFALLIPFYRMGTWVFGSEVPVFSLAEVKELIELGLVRAIRTLWVVTMHALVAWLAAGIVACAVLYVALLPCVRRLNRKVQLSPKRVPES